MVANRIGQKPRIHVVTPLFPTLLALVVAACGSESPNTESGALESPTGTGGAGGQVGVAPPPASSGPADNPAPSSPQGAGGAPGPVSSPGPTTQDPTGPAGQGGGTTSPGAGGATGGAGGNGTVAPPSPGPTTPTTPEPAGPGAGGVNGSGGQSGTGGTPPASAGGMGPEAAGGTPGAGGASTPAPSGEGCPADATFCSGFEGADLPEGAVFKWFGDPATSWTTLFEVDSTVQFAGASSLRVKKNAEPNANTLYKMLAVPSGGANFWARMYILSDIDLGQDGHNAYAAASANDDPNDGSRVEFADDVGLSFNASDNVRWPEGYGRLSSGGNNAYTLPANEWHCIELHFDGTARVQTLYIEGEEVLVAQDYPASAINFTVFKFGYLGYHNEADRGLWYDEVAVAPSRIGCE